MTNSTNDDHYFRPYKISDLTSLETLRETVLYFSDYNDKVITYEAEKAWNRIMELKTQKVNAASQKEIKSCKEVIWALAFMILTIVDEKRKRIGSSND